MSRTVRPVTYGYHSDKVTVAPTPVSQNPYHDILSSIVGGRHTTESDLFTDLTQLLLSAGSGYRLTRVYTVKGKYAIILGGERDGKNAEGSGGSCLVFKLMLLAMDRGAAVPRPLRVGANGGRIAGVRLAAMDREVRTIRWIADYFASMDSARMIAITEGRGVSHIELDVPSVIGNSVTLPTTTIATRATVDGLVEYRRCTFGGYAMTEVLNGREGLPGCSGGILGEAYWLIALVIRHLQENGIVHGDMHVENIKYSIDGPQEDTSAGMAVARVSVFDYGKTVLRASLCGERGPTAVEWQILQLLDYIAPIYGLVHRLVAVSDVELGGEIFHETMAAMQSYLAAAMEPAMAILDAIEECSVTQPKAPYDDQQTLYFTVVDMLFRSLEGISFPLGYGGGGGGYLGYREHRFSVSSPSTQFYMAEIISHELLEEDGLRPGLVRCQTMIYHLQCGICPLQGMSAFAYIQR